MSDRAESFLIGLVDDGVKASPTPATHGRDGDVQGLRYLYRPINLADLGPAGQAVHHRAADTAALGTLPGPLGVACSHRHRTKNVQSWTMGHARVMIEEAPAAAEAPAADGSDIDSPEGTADGEFLHFYTATVGSVFFEVVERRGSYDGYGAPNAPVRHAVQYDHLHQLKLTA